MRPFIPEPPKRKPVVFDDFRAYKLRVTRSLNNGVFQIEKTFIPLLVIKDFGILPFQSAAHNNKYIYTSDLGIIHRLIESNGGFNFSLLSFDVSDFILAPGLYVRVDLINPSITPAQLLSFPYNLNVFNPLADQANLPPLDYEQVNLTVQPRFIDYVPLLVYLEV